MSVDKPSMRSSSRRQSPARSSMTCIMRDDSASERVARMPGNSVRKKTLAHRNPALQAGRLGGNVFHRRALHRLGDCFRVAKVVLLSFRIRAHVFRGLQWGFVTVVLKFGARGMPPNTCPQPV